MRLIINIKKTATLSRIEELGAYLQQIKEVPYCADVRDLVPSYGDVIESVSMEK